MKLTLLALAEFGNLDGTRAYPGMTSLARLSSQSEKTCMRSMDAANGRWFDRKPVKFAGRDWRGYEYRLKIPEGADTVSPTGRELADTVSPAQGVSCGHSGGELRTFEPRGADTVSYDLGKAPRKSTKEEKQPSGKKKSTSQKRMNFDQWTGSVPDDQDLIPANHHAFRYAEKVGIPRPFLDLAWAVFQERYRDDAKAKYADWPAHFRKAVEANWYGLWWIDGDGCYLLTTKGKQADTFHETGIQSRPPGASGSENRLPRLTA